YTEIPQADCMSGKEFLGNMTENLQADCVQSRQACFIQCFLNVIKQKTGQLFPAESLSCFLWHAALSFLCLCT
ncbi:hypothetical protein, partial [Ruminococcus callidus]